MNPGFQFEKTVDEVPFRIVYTKHFVERYEVGDPQKNRKPVKSTVTEEVIRQKIEEALGSIAEIVYGDPDAQGVIVSYRSRFIMTFSVIERQNGFQVNMVATSPELKFQAKSPSDYTIKVNPTFEVIFAVPVSYPLKVSILADLAENGMDLEDGGTFHLGGDLMDFWVEKTGLTFHVVQADWSNPTYEIQVS